MTEKRPGDAIRRRDDILQVMFWMRGEGLGDEVDAATLGRFLQPRDAAAVPGDLELLRRAGLLEPATGARYRLTETGAEEAGRRFAETFEGLTGQGHGACSDPHCDCHTLGPEACTHSHAH